MNYEAIKNFDEFLAAVAPNATLHPDGFSAELARHTGGVNATPHAQQKPWGGEVWHVYGERIALKTLFVAAGQRLSDQSHNEKEEAWIFQTEGWAVLDGEEVCFKPGSVVHLKPGTRHRLLAKDKPVIVVEASTAELMDVVRHADDYNRDTPDQTQAAPEA